MKSTLQQSWKHLSLATLPPSRRGSSLVFDKKRQQTVFVAAGETWLWNGTVWSKARTPKAPPARNTAHLTYDIATECVLLFGGIGVDGTPLNDVWLWNGSTWIEQHPAHFPAPVGGASLACHAANQQVILFGGIAGFDGITGSDRIGTFSNETWLWDGTDWQAQSINNAPPARVGGQLVYDEIRQQTLLFGGHSFTGYLNDTWAWNGTGWVQLHPAMLPPVQAQYHIAFHEQLQKVILLTQIIDQSQHAYQIWLWDGTSWSQYSQDEVLPGNIESLAYDGAHNMVISCVVTGEKASPGNKSSGTILPASAAFPPWQARPGSGDREKERRKR